MAKRKLRAWEERLAISIANASAFKGRTETLDTPKSVKFMTVGESYILSYLGIRRLGPDSEGIESPYLPRLLNVPPGTVHSNLRKLKDKGLVKMVSRKKGVEKAASIITLTKQGQEAYEELGPFLDESASELRKKYRF